MEATLPIFYSNFLQATPLLTKEQECELSNDVLNGTKRKSENAIKKLVESNLKLVIKIATKDYFWYSERDDIISEGNLGLVKAAEKYDSNFGARFSTYAAFYIKQRMMMHISKSNLIPMSTEMNKTYYRIQKIIENLSNELGYDPSLQEVAERFGSNVERLENILNYKFSYTKIDIPFDNIKGGKTLSDTLKDENAVSPDKFAEYNSDVVELNEYLKELKPRELFIIKKRFGFDGDEPMILQDIGNTLKITRERTRQIQEIALKKIKKNLKDRNKLLKKSVDELEEKCKNAFR